MTYAAGNQIQASDYNTFLNGVNQLNTVLGVGNGDSGYGQPQIPAVSANTQATATQWATLINKLNAVRTHQSGSGTGIAAPTAGSQVAYLPLLASGITAAYTNRLLSATVGTTVTGTVNTFNSVNAAYNVAVSQFVDINVTFASAQQARYFFNAGGKINFVVSASSLNSTSRSSSLANSINTAANLIVLNNSNSVTALGYRQLTTSAVEVKHTAATLPYYGAYATLSLFSNGLDTTNGANGASVVCRLYFTTPADNSYGGNAYVQVSTRADITPPETVNLTNTWGTPTVTFDYA
jgi:hypothetical protein